MGSTTKRRPEERGAGKAPGDEAAQVLLYGSVGFGHRAAIGLFLRALAGAVAIQLQCQLTGR
jgi:hypothetical protein